MIQVGTSGYSYKDWVGPFYPPGAQSADYLQYYSKYFTVVEINSTYYRIPPAKTFSSILDKAPSNFHYTVKLSKEFTHDRGKIDRAVSPFRDAISPLVRRTRLVALLAQFPYSFKPTKESYDHLKKIGDVFDQIPVQVEFRNEFWINEKTFDFLRCNNLGYVCVDMPSLPRLVPPLAKATSSIAYVRLHGREKEHWWNPPQPHDRYNYLYSKNELKEWVPKIRRLAEKSEITFVFFNNHFQGKSARNAALMADLLDLSPPEINVDPQDMKFPIVPGDRLF